MPPALHGRHTHAPTQAVSRRVLIALDIEQLVYEVSTLLNAASPINRMSKP